VTKLLEHLHLLKQKAVPLLLLLLLLLLTPSSPIPLPGPTHIHFLPSHLWCQRSRCRHMQLLKCDLLACVPVEHRKH
jgi:hypothetical protein